MRKTLASETSVRKGKTSVLPLWGLPRNSSKPCWWIWWVHCWRILMISQVERSIATPDLFWHFLQSVAHLVARLDVPHALCERIYRDRRTLELMLNGIETFSLARTNSPKYETFFWCIGGDFNFSFLNTAKALRRFSASSQIAGNTNP